jgi:hypothetical protein
MFYPSVGNALDVGSHAYGKSLGQLIRILSPAASNPSAVFVGREATFPTTITNGGAVGFAGGRREPSFVSHSRHHAERHARAHDHNDAGGSENMIVARQLPTTMGWLCTRDGCGMAFAELTRLQTHAESHTPRRATTAGSKRKQSVFGSSSNVLQLRKKLKHDTSNQFVCTFEKGCRFITDDEHLLREHIRSHMGEHDSAGGAEELEPSPSWGLAAPPAGSFVCPHGGCSFRARKIIDFQAHLIQSKHDIRSMTGGDSPPWPPPAPTVLSKACKCPWEGCTFSTALKRNLKAHTRSHTGERPFHCVWGGCSYTSARAGDLKQHARIHTGEKPFVCTWAGCDYTAAQASNLKRHSLVHTGERPYPCTWDGCRYRSTTASNLKHHARTHTRERPFGCTWDGCEYRAARAGDLKKHLHKHLERGPTAHARTGEMAFGFN